VLGAWGLRGDLKVEPLAPPVTFKAGRAVYLGGTSFRQLRRAGLVEERTTGALARADAMFTWDPAPWSPYVF